MYYILNKYLFNYQVGDHIAVIDDANVVGCRHYEVAKILKQIEKGSNIRLSLFEPIKLGFGESILY